MTPLIHDVLETDVVIVGAGVAGLTAALDLQPLRVHLVTKTSFGSGGASSFAQGGMAAAVGPDDSPALHAVDTVAVSGGLADATAVALLTQEGPAIVEKLLQLGVRFDRDSSDGLALAREAAHSRPRILHARDATGAEIVRALSLATQGSGGVEIFENTFACDLAVAHGRAQGVISRDASGEVRLHLARAVVVATGGLGRVYSRTTNPPEATGDGLAMAARAGVRLADLEFVQFHPTALDVGADPMPLLTEALRGRGAIVLDDAGRRFLFDAHPAGELAPRDVVARAIAARIAAGHRVALDARDAIGEAFPEAFPTVFALCRQHGLDPRRDTLPVAPAAHYHMGGIAVDGNGRTSLPGLWACGEVASTGAHGANRLASNSLLEAVVFGGRVARDIATNAVDAPAPRFSGSERHELAARTVPANAELASKITREVRETMWRDVGLLRNAMGLKRALTELSPAAERLGESSSEAANLACCGALIASAALERRESRGSHFREDAPAANPGWAHRSVVTPAVAAPVPGGER